MVSVLLCKKEPEILATYLEQYLHDVHRKVLEGRDFESATIIGEIKRTEDMFNSVLDRRLINQAKKMWLKKGKRAFLIMAGVYSDSRLRLEPVMGALVKAAYDYNVTAIQVPLDEQIIAWVIHTLLKYDGKPPRPNDWKMMEWVPKLRDNVTENMLKCVPGIGWKTAKAIANVLPTIKEVSAASIGDLQKIPTIGPKIATSVHNAVHKGEVSE
ncbi:MAG: helix-hairpin-helix domain-containing protein [Candidatus Thorarchaeota archaeon]